LPAFSLSSTAQNNPGLYFSAVGKNDINAVTKVAGS
jgi:hypothetical protein